MKVHTSETNLEIEVAVKQNDERIDEFILASRPTNNNAYSSTKECFVPFEDGQSVSIYTWFTGSVADVTYDLYIDGAYYGSRTIMADRNGGGLKLHKRRRAEFRGIQAAEQQQDNDARTDDLVVDAELVARRVTFAVDPARLRNNGRAFGVGSIVVRVSCETEPWNRTQYEPDSTLFPDYLHGNWLWRDAIVNDPTIPADMFVDLRAVFRGVIHQKCNKFRHDYSSLRNGRGPVATFIFLYRSRATLQRAGCIPAPDRYWTIAEEGRGASPVRTESNAGDASSVVIDPPPLDSGMTSDDRRPRRLGDLLGLEDIAATTSFQDFVIDTETERESHWRKQGYSTRHSITHHRADHPTTKLLNGGYREVVIGDQRWILPAHDIFDALIMEEGTLLKDLATKFFPGCKEDVMYKAVHILVEHLKDHVAIIEDEKGQLMAMHEEEYDNLVARYERRHERDHERDNQAMFDTPAHFAAAPLPSQDDVRAKRQQTARQHKLWLEEETRRINAVLQELNEAGSDEDPMCDHGHAVGGSVLADQSEHQQRSQGDKHMHSGYDDIAPTPAHRSPARTTGALQQRQDDKSSSEGWWE